MKVVIIGAGVAGLSIGWRLAQQRIETVVLERAQPGRGATWAAAGMIAAPHSTVDKTSGERQLADRGAQLWTTLAAEIEDASSRKIAYSLNGSLILGRTPAEANELLRLSDLGAGELLTAHEAHARESRTAPDTIAALWNPRQAKVDNRALGKALAAAFVRAGGNLQLNEAAIRFEVREERILGVRTPFSLHMADAYVLAAGAWSALIDGLPAEARPPVVPIKGQMLALEAAKGELLPVPSIGGGEIYLVSQRDRLLIGATVERVGFDSGLTDEAAEWMHTSAIALMPCLREWPVVEHWAGLRPGSPDDMPLLGKTNLPGLFVASGQYRNGILYAPAIAEGMAAIITGEPVPGYLSRFDPRRFAADAPFATGYSE